jgi:hypothetical protein
MAKGDYFCEFCRRELDTERGLSSHISQTPACYAKHVAAAAEAKANRADSIELDVNQEDLDLGQGYDDQEDPFVPGIDPTPPRTSPSLPPSPKRTRMEEVPDDADTEHRWTEPCPEEYKAGGMFGYAPTRFETIRKVQQERNLQPWAPFDSKKDWELAKWVIESGTSNKDADKLLKLESVRQRMNLQD